MRLYVHSEKRDLRKFLEGVLLGMLACIVLYTAFGWVLVHIHAERIASTMNLFLLNGMAALIMPDDPYLRGFHHELGSALLLGICLGIWTALLTAVACIVPWLRGFEGNRLNILLPVLLIPIYLFFTFSTDAPVVSIVCSLLTPAFFLIPWIHSTRRSERRKRNRLRVFLFLLLFFLPFYSFKDLSFTGLRDAMIDLPIAHGIANFYYNHTLLAAQVIKSVRHDTQMVIALSEDVEFPQNLPHGSLWIKSADPCSIQGSSLVVGTERSDCSSFVLSSAGPFESGAEILLEAGKEFDGNKTVRRCIRWFLRAGLVVALVLLVIWLAMLVEDVLPRHRGIAFFLVGSSLILAASGFYTQYLEHVLHSDPRRVHVYASSTSARKRYMSLHSSTHSLAGEELESLAGDPSPGIRHSAFVQMGERADPSFLSACTKGLADPEQIVRTKVCKALGEMGGEEALRLLEHVVMQDPSWYVRDYAFWAIGRIRPVSKKVETR